MACTASKKRRVPTLIMWAFLAYMITYLGCPDLVQEIDHVLAVWDLWRLLEGAGRPRSSRLPRYPAIDPRPDPDLKRRAQEAVAETGTDLNAFVISCLQWLVGDTDDLLLRPNDLPPPTDRPGGEE
jgi:hypothetical protein